MNFIYSLRDIDKLGVEGNLKVYSTQQLETFHKVLQNDECRG